MEVDDDTDTIYRKPVYNIILIYDIFGGKSTKCVLKHLIYSIVLICFLTKIVFRFYFLLSTILIKFPQSFPIFSNYPPR